MRKVTTTEHSKVWKWKETANVQKVESDHNLKYKNAEFEMMVCDQDEVELQVS